MFWLYLLVPFIIVLGAAVVINRRRRRSSISYDSESAARLTGARADDNTRHFGGGSGG
jgi:hypothetical protein